MVLVAPLGGVDFLIEPDGPLQPLVLLQNAGREKVHPAHRGVAAVLQKEGETVRGALHFDHRAVVEGEPVLELCSHLGPHLLAPVHAGLEDLLRLPLGLKGLLAQCGYLPHQIQVLLLRLLIKRLIKRLRKCCRLGVYLRAAQQEALLGQLLAPLLGEELHGETSFRWIKDGAYLPFIIQGIPAGRKEEKLRLTGRALCDTIKGTFGYEPSVPAGRAGRF